MSEPPSPRDITAPPPLSTAPEKRGRKHKPFVTSQGEVISGLYWRRPD